MASLIDQIFMQAGAGSAQGEGFGDFYLRGKQVAQEQQRINLAQQQLARQMAMDEINRTTMLQEQQMNAARLEAVMEQRRSTVDNESAFASVNSLVSQALMRKRPELAQAAIREAISTNRGLWRHEGMAALIEDVQVAQRYMDEAAPPAMSNFGKMISERNAASVAGRLEDVKRYDAMIAKQTIPEGFSLRTNPDGTFELTQGAATGLTPTNQTRVQEALSSEIQTIDATERLEPLLTGETVGVRAFVESIVKDKLLSQVMEGVASENRADAKTIAADLRAARLRALRSDSQIGVKEVALIEEVVPQINAPFESAEGQRNLVKSIRKVSAIRAAYKAKLLGEPIPEIAVRNLDDKDIIDMLSKGLISRQQAIDARKSREQ